jgi:hypothetical protein
MSAHWRACGRSEVWYGGLKRGLGGAARLERAAEGQAPCLHGSLSLDCMQIMRVLSHLHAPDQQALLLLIRRRADQ